MIRNRSADRYIDLTKSTRGSELSAPLARYCHLLSNSPTPTNNIPSSPNKGFSDLPVAPNDEDELDLSPKQSPSRIVRINSKFYEKCSIATDKNSREKIVLCVTPEVSDTPTSGCLSDRSFASTPILERSGSSFSSNNFLHAPPNLQQTALKYNRKLSELKVKSNNHRISVPVDFSKNCKGTNKMQSYTTEQNYLEIHSNEYYETRRSNSISFHPPDEQFKKLTISKVPSSHALSNAISSSKNSERNDFRESRSVISKIPPNQTPIRPTSLHLQKDEGHGALKPISFNRKSSKRKGKAKNQKSDGFPICPSVPDFTKVVTENADKIHSPYKIDTADNFTFMDLYLV